MYNVLQLAESLYVKSGQFKAAVEMYIKSDQWEPAYRIAVECMGTDEVHGLYLTKAEELEAQGRLREAERLYVLVKEPDLAISMYNKTKQVKIETNSCSRGLRREGENG